MAAEDYKDELYLRSRWGGLLHPNTGTSQIYDFVQISFLVYILVMVPVSRPLDACTSERRWRDCLGTVMAHRPLAARS